MGRFTKEWAIDAGERIVATFVVAFLGALLVVPPPWNEKVWQAAAFAGVVAALDVVKVIAASFIGSPDSASLVPSVGECPDA